MKSPALPFGERIWHFELHVLIVSRSKGSRAFDTIEVVVETRRGGEKHGAGYTLEGNVLLQLILKGCLDHGKGFFLHELVSVENWSVTSGEDVSRWKTLEGIYGAQAGNGECSECETHGGDD